MSKCCYTQGTQIKDVKIAEDAPKKLLLEKHSQFIATYGKKKDTDYVRIIERDH